jgi:hypothetical protein
MPDSCCAKPIVKVIKVGSLDAGIVGLEVILKNVFSAGIEDEEQVKTDLLRWVKEFGNYITPGKESEYKAALFREYQAFIAKTKRDAKQETSGAIKHSPQQQELNQTK